ncbi:TadE/TadG family type IV pilus assembly protein [Vibrio paucivorans]
MMMRINRYTQARTKRPSRRKQKGLATIEFVMGFMAFWLMCMAWVEMSYLSYVSAIGDLSVSEAARQAKKSEQNYQQVFHNTIHDSDSLWTSLVSESNFRLSVQFLKDIEALKAYEEACEGDEDQPVVACGEPFQSAIAIYRVQYDFSPIFTYFLDTSSLLTREVIVIQEYERDEFEL